MHIHIIGIGGTFMGGLARLAVQAGHRVTGCDHALYPPMSDQLAELGVEIVDGFGEDNLALAPDLWVIGNVAARGMPIVEAILERGLPYTSGPAWLHDHILPGRHVLAVAGTHGKTTTTSMLTWILEYAGLQPSFLIGGVPADFGTSARLVEPATAVSSRGGLFVIEADEYDTAFFDKRSKFLHYPARTAILNNLEFDHADIFADLNAIQTQFHHWVRTLPRSARVIVPEQLDAEGGTEMVPALAQVLQRGCYSEVMPVGRSQWWADDVDVRTGAWTVKHRLGTDATSATAQARITQMVAGAHNRSNALAAIAAAQHVGVDLEVAAAALSQFQGVARRLQVRGVVHDIAVIDDFAHHPTAIQVTVEAVLSQTPGRVIAVIEPRSNTMKLGVMAQQLAPALAPCAAVLGYQQGLSWDLAAALAPLGEKAQVHQDLDALVAACVAIAQPGDRILVMSNGGFGGVHNRLLSALAERWPQASH